jgi:hypothetical protein
MNRRSWLFSLGLLFGLLGLGFLLWRSLAHQAAIFPFSRDE